MECHRSQITLPLWRMRSTAGGVDEFRRAMCPTHRTAGGYCRFCGSPVGIWPRCDWLIAWNADIAGPGRKTDGICPPCDGPVVSRRDTAPRRHRSSLRPCRPPIRGIIARSLCGQNMDTPISSSYYQSHDTQSYQCIDRKKEERRGHHLYRRETIHRTAGGASVPVRWVSGKYPDRLYRALMGSSTVFTGGTATVWSDW